MENPNIAEVRVVSEIKQSGIVFDSKYRQIKENIESIPKPTAEDHFEFTYERAVGFQPQQFCSISLKVGIVGSTTSASFSDAMKLSIETVEMILMTEAQRCHKQFFEMIRNLK